VQELGGSIASGNIACHRCYAQFVNESWPGGRNWFSLLHVFGSSLVQEFELFQDFGLVWEFCTIHKFRVVQSLLRD